MPVINERPRVNSGDGPGQVAAASRGEKEFFFGGRRPFSIWQDHAVTGNAITSALFVGTGEKVTRCAWAILCSRLRCPYVFIASAPPSLCPSQRETVGMSTPDSIQRVANKCRKSWCVIRSAPTFLHARSNAFWHSPTRKTFAAGDSFGRPLRIRSNNARASGINGTRRNSQFFVPVAA